jgi:prepilin-type N-terminal cleavage/methylation domain-containing protein
MNRQCKTLGKKFGIFSASGHRGFTLIETLLSVAILLVLSFVVYQGFMATIKYSWNTTRFEKSVVSNSGTVNQQLAGSSSSTATPDKGIYLTWTIGGSTEAKVLGGQRYAAVPAVNNINVGDSSYQESTSLASSHQYGFSYLPPRCPNDGNELLWYANSTNYFLVCPLGDTDIDMGAK